MPEISLPLLPAQEAIDYFLAKGFEPTFAWQDFYAEHHARDFTVAKMMRMDLLQTVHEHLTRAMTDGLSLQQFSERLRPILEKEGWWGVKAMEDPHTGATVAARLGSPQRLQIIYDTNLRTSYAVGRWRRGERNAAHQPLLLYRTMRDGRVRASHARYDGVTLPRTHVWWDTHYPPNGWRCRCLAYPISDDGVAELKKSHVGCASRTATAVEGAQCAPYAAPGPSPALGQGIPGPAPGPAARGRIAAGGDYPAPAGAG